MIANNTSISSSKFYGSSFLEKSDDNKNELLNINIEPIKIDYNYNHYFCCKCQKFPFIKFCKDGKNVRITCS